MGRPLPSPSQVLDRRGEVIPSRSDGFVAAVSQSIGGPLGHYAALGARWWNPTRVALAVGTLNLVLGYLWRLPCRITAPGQSPDWFRLMCYSDIPLLYDGRGLLAGKVPYLDSGDYPTLEYPVLTGWFLDLERRIAASFGAAQGSGLGEQAKIDSTLLFYDVNAVLLGALFLVTVWAQVHTTSGRPWDAMLLAASPCVAAAGLINWDLLPIALTALACLAWSRKRLGWAGLLIGLGTAAKLYPVLLLGPLLLLCLRGRKLPEFGVTLSTAAMTWAAVNLPVLIAAPEGWRYFWTFNSDRGADLGSIWYVLSLAGAPVEQLNAVSTGLLLAGCAAIGALILLAPRRPRIGQVAFLVVVVFLLTSKVYSPQYVLWLLPLLILARPRWREWWIFTAGELFYFAAIWWHLAGVLGSGDGSGDRIYWLAVITRLGTQCFIAAVVVRDILRPGHDVVRAAGVDDPAGGVLDGALDATWRYRLRPAPPR